MKLIKTKEANTVNGMKFMLKSRGIAYKAWFVK